MLKDRTLTKRNLMTAQTAEQGQQNRDTPSFPRSLFPQGERDHFHRSISPVTATHGYFRSS